MSGSAERRLAVRYMLVGAVSTLAIIGIVWAVTRLGDRGSPTSPPEAPPVSQPTQTAPTVAATAEAGPPEAPQEAAPVETPSPATVAPAADASSTQKAAEATDTPADEQAAQAAAEEAEREARRVEREKELAFMRDRFDGHKKKLMEIIDSYFALPIEDRPAYFQEALGDFAETIRAEREEAGLPARPRRQQEVFREFLGMLGDNATEEEKQKTQQFIGDIIQMQAARFQAEMAERMKTRPPGADAPAP